MLLHCCTDTADNLTLRKILNPSKPEHTAILRASRDEREFAHIWCAQLRVISRHGHHKAPSTLCVASKLIAV